MWSRVAVLVWVVLIGSLLGYEAFALLDQSVATPPLTHVIVRYVPEEITVVALGWLFYHFLVRYWRRKS